MDVTKYRKYIRDIHIEDNDLEDTIKDIIADITNDIKIFRTTIGFTLTSCLDEYNIKTIFNLSSNVDDQVIDIEFSVKDDPIVPTTVINLEKYNGITCPMPETNIETTLITTNSNNIFLGVTELIKVHSDIKEAYLRDSRTLVEDVTEKYFEKINDYTFYVKKKYLETLYSKTYNMTILANCIYRPDPNNINKEQEEIIKPAIIAGLKYFLSDMYLNSPNEQVSNILYQRYWATKKQIRNNLPQLIGTVSEFKMAEWNK